MGPNGLLGEIFARDLDYCLRLLEHVLKFSNCSKVELR